MKETILIAKTRSEIVDIMSLTWDWVKYLSPGHYEWISESRAKEIIKERGMVEVARNHAAILYDTEDKSFLKTWRGYFAKKKIRDEKIKEARTLAKLRNKI